MPARLSFFDAAGRLWLVFDAVIGEADKLRAVHIGDPSACLRVFRRDGDREQRIYSFGDQEPHAVDEPQLERQFIEAQRVERKKAGFSSLTSQ